jgi:hypothetical protein
MKSYVSFQPPKLPLHIAIATNRTSATVGHKMRFQRYSGTNAAFQQSEHISPERKRAAFSI